MNKKRYLKSIIITIIITFIVVTAINWCIDVSIYSVVNSKDVIEALDKNKNDSTYRDGSFLCVGKMTTIYKKSIMLLSLFKYQVYGVGSVYIFTEASYRLDSIYNSYERTDRQKLGLND